MSTPPNGPGHAPRTRYIAGAANRPNGGFRAPRAFLGALGLHLRAPARRLPTWARRPLLVASLLGAGSGAWLLVGRRLMRVKVAGPSMAPELEAGDRLVVWRTTALRPGDIVAAFNPRQPTALIVKRLALLGPEGAVLLGDNVEQSTDSRHFGPVPTDLLVGRAAYRYVPARRAGHLPRRRGHA